MTRFTIFGRILHLPNASELTAPSGFTYSAEHSVAFIPRKTYTVKHGPTQVESMLNDGDRFLTTFAEIINDYEEIYAESYIALMLELLMMHVKGFNILREGGPAASVANVPIALIDEAIPKPRLSTILAWTSLLSVNPMSPSTYAFRIPQFPWRIQNDLYDTAAESSIYKNMKVSEIHRNGIWQNRYYLPNDRITNRTEREHLSLPTIGSPHYELPYYFRGFPTLPAMCFKKSSAYNYARIATDLCMYYDVLASDKYVLAQLRYPAHYGNYDSILTTTTPEIMARLLSVHHIVNPLKTIDARIHPLYMAFYSEDILRQWAAEYYHLAAEFEDGFAGNPEVLVSEIAMQRIEYTEKTIPEEVEKLWKSDKPKDSRARAASRVTPETLNKVRAGLKGLFESPNGKV